MAQQTEFEIELEQIHAAEYNLNRTNGQLREDLLQMKASIDTLNARWTGPAHDTFVAEFASDFETAMEIWEDLGQCLDDIHEACVDYMNCEDEVYSVIQAVRIGG